MKIQQSWPSVAVSFLACASLATIDVGAGASDAPRGPDLKCLAIAPVNEDPNTPPLALLQVSPLSINDDVRTFEWVLKFAPGATNLRSLSSPIGTAAFVVTRPRNGVAAKGLEGKRVVGIVYAQDSDAPTLPVWKGALIHSPPSKSAYLVLAQGRGTDLTLAVFAVDLEANLGTFPPAFPPANLEAWPKPMKPISEIVIKGDRDSAEFVPVGGIDLMLDQDKGLPDREGDSKKSHALIVTAHAKKRSGFNAQRLFRFDLETKTWTTAKIIAGKALK